MNLKTRTTCRICGSKLVDVLDLGSTHIAGYISDSTSPIKRTVPLVLTRCDPESDENACGLVQLRHTAPSDFLYRNYYYRSGINQSMTKHLHAVASHLDTLAKLSPDDMIVDQSCSLHVCIKNGAADKFEAALFHVFAHRIGLC